MASRTTPSTRDTRIATLTLAEERRALDTVLDVSRPRGQRPFRWGYRMSYLPAWRHQQSQAADVAEGLEIVIVRQNLDVALERDGGD